MEFDMSLIFGLVKKLVLMIFEKYDVLKEFEALGIDIAGLLGDETEAVPKAAK